MASASLIGTVVFAVLLLINLSAAAQWSFASANKIAFMPRGGGAIGFRKGKSTTTQPDSVVATETNEEIIEDDEESAEFIVVE